MKNIINIARWEYLERIKNKTFLLSAFLFPFLLITISYLPVLLGDEEERETAIIGLIEKNISIQDRLDKELSVYQTTEGQPVYIITKFVTQDNQKEKLIDSAYKLIKDKLLTGILYIEKISDDSLLIEYHAENVTAIRNISRLEKSINNVLINTRLEALKVDKEIAEKLVKRASMKTVKVTQKGGEEVKSSVIFVSSYFFILFLIIAMLSVASSMVRSILEEKSNRVIEIILSSCSTDEFLAGKVLGQISLGFTQIFIWFAIIISVLGPITAMYIRTENIPINILFFILGFIFYSSLFIGIGSLASSEQEAQGIFSFVSLILVLPIVTSFIIFESPNSTIAKVLSFFPLTTASTMMIRISTISISVSEILMTIFILILSIILSILFSSRIFRISLLSYGKTPNISEVINWLKQK